MLRFDDLQLFVRIAREGSLSAAARQLAISPAVASAGLKRLEQQLQARLFVRSTRSLRLTAEGEGFLEHARQALQSLEAGRQQLAGSKSAISGPLQLSVPSDFGRNTLLPWLETFMQTHPQVQLRLLLGDRVTDLFREPVDIALRYGEPEDSRLVALPVAPGNRRVLCAAPAYLQRHGEPRQIGDLREHNCLIYMLGGRAYERWRFHEGDAEHSLQVAGDRLSDDADVVRRWAVAGAGVVYKSWLDVAGDVHAGRLTVLLPDLQGEPTPLNLICTHREQLSKPVHLLRDFVQARCAELLAQAPWGARVC
ncbi:DNA-binding transcriptional LysR family regulator [Pseudomonas sp. BIGb0408]|uniref:DNA-binding transcriptional LysR family regulator n=1 Tax=Phytopseudomonas flavescens TaxID=29435 RepID=A0A7Z0BR69_9GAMM|nr:MULTISPECIES: LysR family transcriptional regulator [Pseudomonas]MCW2294189.1 DNA-binding transcriptional LysR family regulator [Pseudomonas sp. BIGb0408]NYH76537.1 DNA-binding transcriptional LysR family regulator [Pseudomonas flavescens]